MAEIEPAYRRARPHRVAFSELDADALPGIEQAEQGRLFGVVWLRRIAGGRADTAVFFLQEIVGGRVLVRRVAPELLADALVQRFGKGLGEAVGEGFDDDRGIVIVLPFEAFGDEVLLEARGDDEGADIVGDAHRRDEVGEREVGPVLLLG